MEDNKIEHISSITKAIELVEKSSEKKLETITKEYVYNELNKANVSLWYCLPVAQIYPGLFLGNVFNAQDIHFRKNNNIKTIINCATFEAQPQLFDTLTYICLNASDDDTYKIIEKHFDFIYEIIELSLEKGHNVLIHCQCGVNRSSTLAIAYLCMKTQCSIEQAILDVFRIRPCILTNIGFRDQLFDWASNQYWIQLYEPQSISLIELNSNNESDVFSYKINQTKNEAI